MEVGDVKIFYPQFCLDCFRNFISKTELNPCRWCNSENVIGYRRTMYKGAKMSGSCRNPKVEPQALYNMMKIAFDEPEKMTKEKLKRMYHKITGMVLSDQEADKALTERNN